MGTIDGKRIKIIRIQHSNKGERMFCKFFNEKKDCSYGNKCKHKHACDVMKNDGTACGGNHARVDHTGKTVDA